MDLPALPLHSGHFFFYLSPIPDSITVLLKALSAADFPTAFLKTYGVFKQIGKRTPEYPRICQLKVGHSNGN